MGCGRSDPQKPTATVTVYNRRIILRYNVDMDWLVIFSVKLLIILGVIVKVYTPKVPDCVTV